MPVLQKVVWPRGRRLIGGRGKKEGTTGFHLKRFSNGKEDEKMRNCLKLTVFFVLSLGLLATTANNAASAPMELKVVSYATKGYPSLVGLDYYADLVSKRSGGKLEIKWAGGPEVFSPRDLLEKCGQGLVDLVHCPFGYWASVAPEFGYDGLPFDVSWEGLPKLVEASAVPADKVLNKKGVKLLVASNYTVVQRLVTKKPVHNMEDLRGRVIRGYGLMPAKMLEALGASSVVLPSAELYTALDRGTVDGAMYNLMSFMEYKLHEIGVRYVVDNPLTYGFACGVVMNMGKYKKLSPDLQKVLLEAGRETDLWAIEYWRKEDAKAKKDAQGKGVTFYNLTADEADRWKTKLVADLTPIFLGLKGADPQILKEFIELTKKKW
ncbi:MAG: TRAP transporter substrate-binding protein DctP [Pseudomonadota bacterium]